MRLSRDLASRFEHFKWEATLNTHESPAEIIAFLTKDWEWCKKHDAFSFSIMVNNAEYYTGTMYTDAYTIAWGYIQRRGDDIVPGEAYTFVRNHLSTGGADPVLKKLGSGNSVTKTFNSGVFSKSASGTINVSGYRYVLINSIQIGNPNASSSSSGKYTFGDISAGFRRSPASYDNPARMPNWFALNGREVIPWSYNSSDNDNMIVSYTLVE